MEPLQPPTASPLVSLGIAALALAVAAWIVWACGQAGGPDGRRRRAIVAGFAIAAWMGLGWTLAERGVFARFANRPPPLTLFILVAVLGAVALGLSPLGRRMALAIPLAVLVGVQAFRLPLELVMHCAASEGVMPEQMSFSGRNFDIVSGAGALLLAVLLALGLAPRALVWAWNIAGALLLANIVAIAVASFPMFHAFGATPERLNTWVAFPPFVWLPTILVPAALLGHILVTRRLLAAADR